MRTTLRALACAGASATLISTALAGPAAAETSVNAATPGYVREAARANAVRVSTYNICKSTCGSGRYAWAHRRGALVNEVRWANPHVLLIQEANTKKWHGTTHLDDVRRLLAKAGYSIASTRLTCTRKCTKGAHVFYKPAQMALSALPNKAMAPAGMLGLSKIARVSLGGYQDRAVSWAFLTPRGSTRPTLYISVHLITQQTGRGETLRKATAAHMRSFAAGLIKRAGLKGNVPIVVGGDFNSYQRRQPHGAQWVMGKSGFVDGYDAPVRANARLSTVNYAPKISRYKGFPPRPYKYGNKTSPARIDYVFSTVAPQRHEVVVRLTKSGRFDDRYRASDHNMVMVDLPLR